MLPTSRCWLEVERSAAIIDRLLVLDPDLTVKFADRSFGDAFTVTPKDTPRDQEGQQ